jgi:hypothetical protein
MLCIYGSSSWELLYLGRFLWDIVQFWKFFIGFLEVSYGIFCIFGSSSWNCVNFGSSLFIRFCALLDVPRGLFWKFSAGFCAFWNFLMGFCAYLAVPLGILCIFEIPHGKAYTCP